MNRVRYWHFRALRYCNRGLMAWFKVRGIAWQSVLDDGVDADVLRATGDAMAIRAVEFAESTGWAEDPADKGGA